jgi:sulfur carrier protein ThiS
MDKPETDRQPASGQEQGQAFVYLEGPLKKASQGEGPLPVHAGQTIRAAAESLGLSKNHTFIALINEQVQELDSVLKPGDMVHLVPQISGGAA